VEEEIRRTCKVLRLPGEIESDVICLFKKVVATERSNGPLFRKITKYQANKKKIAVSVIAIVCRWYKNPRRFMEIAKTMKLNSLRGIKRIACNITRKFGIKLPSIDAADFVPYFCAKLNLNKVIENKAIEIIKEAEEANVSKIRQTASIAAAAIYIAAILYGERRTQKEVSQATSVSETTIRNIYKELTENLGIEVRI